MNDENLKPCKPGETHNPNGRPKGSKSYKTRIKELLAGISQDNDWTSPLAAEKIKIIFSKDKKGKYNYSVDQRQRAIDSILDRVDGKPIQTNINDNVNANYNFVIDETEKDV